MEAGTTNFARGGKTLAAAENEECGFGIAIGIVRRRFRESLPFGVILLLLDR